MTIAVIGLGYVGLPMAVEFGKKHFIIGFDINQRRVDELRKGHDATLEVDAAVLKTANIQYTTNVEDLKSADFFIVAVPTPVDTANKPDLTPLIKASESVGKALKRGDIVVYESTVYPGATEEDCVPILEKISGLKFGTDFTVGYSPERINPGDKEHTFAKIRKIVAGSDADTLNAIDAVYSSVVTAGTFRASSIKVAEAAKVIENTQRDLNIALMNELAVIFKRMDIDTNEVIEAAGSKWNFLKFRPGLVGGHCIGVDPYYLTYKAEKLGYIPQVILAGRRINDNMARFIAQEFVKRLIQSGAAIKGEDVIVYGLTFKENCPDLRNSKVADLVYELKTYGINVWVHDPMADSDETVYEYGLSLTPLEALPINSIGAVVAVAHDAYKTMPLDQLFAPLAKQAVIADVKSVLNPSSVVALGFDLWRL